MDKSSKTIYIGLGVVAVAAAIYALQPTPQPTKSNKKPLPSTGTASKSTLGGARAVAVDYIAPGEENLKFDRLSTTPKNGFRPIIERRTLGRGAGASLAPNAVPTDYAGEGGWVYTGTAAIDNRPSALFENKQKNEAEYVTVGQKWKKCTVQAITSSTVTLVAQGGRIHVVDLLADPPQNAKSTVASTVPAGNMPLSVSPMPGALPSVPGGMTFTMGADGNLTAAPAAAAAATPDAATAQTAGGNNGRRRGRNRGGGGGTGQSPQASVAPTSPTPQFVAEPLPETPNEN
jgi:hypothetical protein